MIGVRDQLAVVEKCEALPRQADADEPGQVAQSSGFAAHQQDGAHQQQRVGPHQAGKRGQDVGEGALVGSGRQQERQLRGNQEVALKGVAAVLGAIEQKEDREEQCHCWWQELEAEAVEKYRAERDPKEAGEEGRADCFKATSREASQHKRLQGRGEPPHVLAGIEHKPIASGQVAGVLEADEGIVGGDELGMPG